MGRGGDDGDMTIREGRHGQGDQWWVGEGITKLKTNVISAAAERKRCLLLGKVCLAACSRGWVQHCGMTLPLNVFVCVLTKSRDVQSVQGRGAERTGSIVLENWFL